MPLTITQVDAFTSRPFGGNPAAVCVLSRPADAAWMQHVAREMNLSETAFLVCRDDGAYDLRWFTPAVEVDLCGHATLASAHVLWESGYLADGSRAVFHTRSGRLSANQRNGWIEMDFPAEPDQPTAAPTALAAGLNADLVYVGRNRLDYLVEVGSEATLRSLAPDAQRLSGIDTRGIIVTALADAHGFDFVSRFFAPGTGIVEDPVTGSAHCCLGPYWQRRLGKADFTAWQASERGGLVRVVVRDDRVTLSGKAVTVIRGELVAGPDAL
ncbi:MAG: PhzF family phenazine biosynthesis protein [Acidobacteriia bacterium]|nr:PhzF family phenazine biosynthesis protein [Terriglobia bacterium]MYG04047.1 PhzF family phenazine biosynthesis protein [Terriglobia bacterium]MYK10346.1 PhzF family phenazine biosynthesis protein [Terriglobia bacterium]